MPFTPFHLGPALALGLPLRSHIHTPTFLLANIIVDVEPFLVLFLGLRYPLHGYLHTFLLAIPLGFLLGYVMFFLERVLQPLYKMFMLEKNDGLGLKPFLLAGGLGTSLHVLFDAPLYSDIRPFYPSAANLLYNPSLIPEIYGLCVWMGVFGVAYYIALAGLSIYRRLSKKTE